MIPGAQLPNGAVLLPDPTQRQAQANQAAQNLLIGLSNAIYVQLLAADYADAVRTAKERARAAKKGNGLVTDAEIAQHLTMHHQFCSLAANEAAAYHLQQLGIIAPVEQGMAAAADHPAGNKPGQ